MRYIAETDVIELDVTDQDPDHLGVGMDTVNATDNVLTLQLYALKFRDEAEADESRGMLYRAIGKRAYAERIGRCLDAYTDGVTQPEVEDTPSDYLGHWRPVD